MATTDFEIKVPVRVFGLRCSLALIWLFRVLRLPESALVCRLAKAPVFIRFKFPWGAKWVWGPDFKVEADYDN